MTNNIWQQLDELKFSIEGLQQGSEQMFAIQDDRKNELQEEVDKLETALNMSITNWKELLDGHSKLKNQTLAILASLADVRAAHSKTKKKTSS